MHFYLHGEWILLSTDHDIIRIDVFKALETWKCTLKRTETESQPLSHKYTLIQKKGEEHC